MAGIYGPAFGPYGVRKALELLPLFHDRVAFLAKALQLSMKEEIAVASMGDDMVGRRRDRIFAALKAFGT